MDFVQDGCRQMRAALCLAGFGWCCAVCQSMEVFRVFRHSFSHLFSQKDARKRRGARPKDKIWSVKRLPAAQSTVNASCTMLLVAARTLQRSTESWSSPPTCVKRQKILSTRPWWPQLSHGHSCRDHKKPLQDPTTQETVEKINKVQILGHRG